jgi:hypothetical protein
MAKITVVFATPFGQIWGAIEINPTATPMAMGLF